MAFSFDFESVSFPIRVSELVVDYLYASHKGDFSRPIGREQFAGFLSGEDRSQEACKALGELTKLQSGCRELPPENFDILSDKVVASDKVRELGAFVVFEDRHKGECRLGADHFEFEYSVTRTMDGYHDFVDLKRGKAVVSMEGHELKKEHMFLHEACNGYLELEQRQEFERLKREGLEKERQVWEEFRAAHEQELKDWLIPILENQYSSRVCRRNADPVLNGTPEFSFVKALDRGYCGHCMSNCQFKEHVLADGEHSDEWYKLGIDKLDFKFL